LRRDFDGQPANCRIVKEVIAFPASGSINFLIAVEGFHAEVHCMIGGSMCNADAASGAPEFFLHHGFLDKVIL
jgi:hypothetical protein